MSRPHSKSPPKYRHHKARDLAVVTLDGRDHYLGKFGSPTSYQKYARLIAEWQQAPSTAPEGPRTVITVAELTLAYWDHCKTYYSRDGQPNGRTAVIRSALQSVNACFADCSVPNFGPLKLQIVRQSLINRDQTRRYINDQIRTITRMFKWGVSQELVPAAVHLSLQTVEGLRKAKSAARESEPVSAVSEDVIQQTLAKLSRTVGAMVRLQLLTGARPGEICTIRPRNVVIPSNGLWCYMPESHKTEHHGKQRRVYLGPEAQSVLQPFMDKNSVAFCFSPSEAEKERRSQLRRHRQTPVQPSQRTRRKRRPQRRPGDRYTKDSYRWAIRRACERASVPSWTPHQLRHTRATQLRKEFGIEAAKVVLGHSDPRITEIYAERDFKMAEEIMSKTG